MEGKNRKGSRRLLLRDLALYRETGGTKPTKNVFNLRVHVYHFILAVSKQPSVSYEKKNQPFGRQRLAARLCKNLPRRFPPVPPPPRQRPVCVCASYQDNRKTLTESPSVSVFHDDEGEKELRQMAPGLGSVGNTTMKYEYVAGSLTHGYPPPLLRCMPAESGGQPPADHGRCSL